VGRHSAPARQPHGPESTDSGRAGVGSPRAFRLREVRSAIHERGGAAAWARVSPSLQLWPRDPRRGPGGGVDDRVVPGPGHPGQALPHESARGRDDEGAAGPRLDRDFGAAPACGLAFADADQGALRHRAASARRANPCHACAGPISEAFATGDRALDEGAGSGPIPGPIPGSIRGSIRGAVAQPDDTPPGSHDRRPSPRAPACGHGRRGRATSGRATSDEAARGHRVR
jgi:hypothetical protein